MIENRAVDSALIRETFAGLRARHPSILVEGVGGWLVPIEQGYTVADLAREFGLPVALVAKNRLGALNHAALTLHHLRTVVGSPPCAGIIFNDGPARPDAGAEAESEEIALATNRSVLEDWLKVPVLHSFGTDEG